MTDKNKSVIGKIEQLTETQDVDLRNVQLEPIMPIRPQSCSSNCGQCSKNPIKRSTTIGPKCDFKSPCIINNGLCPFSMESCSSKPRPLFKTLIRDKVQWIYDRPGIEHELGKMNDCPSTWWLAHASESELTWIPWIDKGANRPCWEINVKQDNYIKYKWEEHDIRSKTSIVMKCNGQIVYEFGCNDIAYGMSKAQFKMIEMMEHPFNFMDPESEIGRRIWYKGQAAVIERLLLDQGCIIMGYRGTGAGFDMSEPWHDEDFCSDDWMGEMSVKDDIFSGSIWWFRDKDQGTKNDNDMVEIVNERGGKQVYPKSLYNQIKYDVEFEFRRQFGIKRGGGNTISFDRKVHHIPEDGVKRPLTIPLKQYDKELQEFHKSLVEKYILTNE